MNTNLIDDIGGPTVVARMVGRRVPTVIEWRTRGVPFMCAPAIEQGTDGKHLVESMCPDAPWLRIPDAAWPHPDGRPVIDPISAKPYAPPTPAASASQAEAEGQGAES